MKKRKEKAFQHLLSDLIKKVSRSRLFVRNFFGLIGILTLFFLIFAITLFSQSKNIIKQEFTAASQYRLEETALAIDSHLMDIRYLIASLNTNHLIQAFYAYKDPTFLYDNYYNQIQQVLQNYVNGFPFVDSIYIYAECSDTIITATGRFSSEQFSDTNWMPYLSDETNTCDNIYIGDNTNGFRLIFRAENDFYPYFLSIIKPYEVNGKTAAIVINLNMSKISQLKELTSDSHQEVYLISDDGQILFRNFQRDITEPISLIPELSHFTENMDSLTVLIDTESEPYTYAQVHSLQYSWNYVLVTHLQEYTARLSSSKAVFMSLLAVLIFVVFLLAFFFSMRSVKPIHNLIQLIAEPQQTLSSDLYNDQEIRYIALQIINYVQQNQMLTEELSSKLNLLNQTKLLALQSQINPHFLFNALNMIHIQESQALGYDHKIPRLTLSLSRLLRYAIESTDLVPLETELEFTRMYIDLQKECYGDNLQVLFNIAPEVLCTKVPKLFIQPIAENAIFHGLAEKMDENSTITITCHLENDFIVVSVRDNGVGMSPEKLAHLQEELEERVPQKNNIGIKNVVTRMNLLYGNAFSIEIDSRQGWGSVFTLRFPFLQ